MSQVIDDMEDLIDDLLMRRKSGKYIAQTLVHAGYGWTNGVKALHRPRKYDPITDGVWHGQTDFDFDVCIHDRERYPCPTVSKLEPAA